MEKNNCEEVHGESEAFAEGFKEGSKCFQDEIDGAKETISRLDDEIDAYKDKIEKYDSLINDLWCLV